MRRLAKGDVIGGFAGATADAFTLFERLEAKLEQYPGQLMRAAVELAKDWRTDRYLRRLEAMMIVADKDVSLVLTGTGDVLEPEAGVMGIGSGGNYALAAARALADDRSRRRDDRAPLARHRGRHLRLHQPQRHDRDVEGGLSHGVAVSVSPDDGRRPAVAAGLARAAARRRMVGRRGRSSSSSAAISSHHDMAQFIVAIDERPFGYLQCYRIERLARRLRPAAGRHARHRPVHRRARHGRMRARLGVHPAVHRRICSRSGAPRIVIDPEPDNARAIRAYEKAGFRARP